MGREDDVFPPVLVTKSMVRSEDSWEKMEGVKEVLGYLGTLFPSFHNTEVGPPRLWAGANLNIFFEVSL